MKWCLLLSVLLTVASSAKDVERDGNLSFENYDYENIFLILSPRSLIETYLDSDFDVEGSYTINERCAKDLVILRRAFDARQKWARGMMDASTKVPSGILDNRIVDLGIYDQCIKVKEKLLETNIQGRHCMYSVSVPGLNVHDLYYPTMSICVPDSCNAQDIAYLVNGTIRMHDGLNNSAVRSSRIDCSLPVGWDTGSIILVAVSAIYIGFLIIVTIYGAYYVPENSAMKFFMKLSLRKHAAAIFDLKQKDSDFNDIHGLRSLSSMWVVLGHEFFTQTFSIISNFHDLTSFYDTWIAIFISMFTLAVDTFFIISGFLMTYQFLKQRLKQKSFDVWHYYLYRFFRITPAVIVILVSAIFVLPKIASGPRWNLLVNELASSSCERKWWSVLLYLQNFVDSDNMCLGHLWYLSVDMQLFWISPIILYPLYRTPKIAFVIISGLLVAWFGISTYVIGIESLPVMSFVHNVSVPMALNLFTTFYEMPHTRIGPWLLGICLAYEIFNYKDRKPGRLTVFAGWFLTVLCMMYCILSTRSLLLSDYEYNWLWETLYFPSSRVAWSIAVCWIMYACIHNCAGFISSILSWRFFLPISRLSFCIYVIHLGIPIMQVAFMRDSQYFSIFYVFRSFLFTYTISAVMAFFLSILIELPMMEVLKHLLKKKEEPSKIKKKISNLEEVVDDIYEEETKIESKKVQS